MRDPKTEHRHVEDKKKRLQTVEAWSFSRATSFSELLFVEKNNDAFSKTKPNHCGGSSCI